MSRSKDRALVWWKCRACGTRQRIPTHPNDRGSTIRIGCPDCGEEREHVPGGFG